MAPQVRLELLPLSGEFDYRRSLATGEVDLVIGNWLEPPEELHLGRLMSDEIVCLVAEDHPVARSAAHAAPGRSSATWPASTWRRRRCTPMRAGVIDEHLRRARRGARASMVRSAHFSLIPLMVAQSLLVLTTGRLFCSRYIDSLPVRIVRCPVPFPPLTYYQLWHDLTHASAVGALAARAGARRGAQPGAHGMLQRSRNGRPRMRASVAADRLSASGS